MNASGAGRSQQDWLFDLGNTRLKFAPLRADGGPGAISVLAYADGAAMDDAALPEGGIAWLASVAGGAVTDALESALSRRFDQVRRARTRSRLGAVRIAYAEPARLGVDRFLAMLGAHAQAPAATLVIGVGTALTIDLMAADGRHLGGRIAPSPALMREALHARARQLPAAGGAFVEFAADTDDALASGCEGAALALVERSATRAAEALGARPALLLHGGGAPSLCPHLPEAVLRPALVLEGLAQWAMAPPRDGAP